MTDLAGLREWFQERNVAVVLVHQGSEAQAETFFANYPGAGDYYRVSDPERHYYRAFNLSEAPFRAVFTPGVLARGIATTLKGHRVGEVIGHPGQTPGAFVVRQGRIIARHPYRHLADRPDYAQLVNGAR